MTSRRLVSLCTATLVPMLVACGGSSTGGTAVVARPGQADTTGSQTDAPSAAGGASNRAGSIDVCALLSEADAVAVAREQMAASQRAAGVYTLQATPTSGSGIKPSSGCKFNISGLGGSGTVEIDITEGDDIGLYRSGKKVPGLGDEAYSGIGQTVVRVGDLMLQTSENSFTDAFAVALYKKMIPKLK
ncbi:hypothetical protein ABIB25_002572 [Nakamurella sp. UYEF19]|uniref:hypothetical protein n=1 Tax=Nakamurella sp. UYEF19 TaxID=1756392 RepID=UPI003390B306